MEVKLVPFDKNEVINKLYIACRTCYMGGTQTDAWNTIDNVDEDKKLKLIKHVLNSYHHSVLEHVQFTFLISGVSRNLTHQLVRHRIASYSQQSLRYVQLKDGKFDFITPAKIKKDSDANQVFEQAMRYTSQAYDNLIKMGIPAEDARAVLPGACASNITVSMNLRSLIHFTDERCCGCAQQEIRTMANAMAKLVHTELPFLKPYLGPKCEMLGYCPESEKRTCGRKPLKENVLG